MRFLLDENVPKITVEYLRSAGHDVLDIHSEKFKGTPDSEIWRLAQTQKRLVVTTDKGFLQHRNELHHGLLIVRLRQPNRQRLNDRIVWATENTTPSEWKNRTMVVRDQVFSFWEADVGRK